MIERVLAIPTKRFDRALVNYLTKDGMSRDGVAARVKVAGPSRRTT